MTSFKVQGLVLSKDSISCFSSASVIGVLFHGGVGLSNGRLTGERIQGNHFRMVHGLFARRKD